MNFLDTYLLLEDIHTDVLTEAKYIEAGPINLSDCRMITSDVKDIRGELEASACLEYNGELTRVQCRTVIIRDTENGKEFLGRDYGRRIGLPGGGYDAAKDNGDILNTAEREAYEEFNFTLSNIKDTGIRVWSHRNDPWVTKHVATEEDRWTGYYTWYVVAEVAGLGDNDNPEEINKWQWLPIDLLHKVNTKLPAFVDTLNEAIHPDKEGRADLGEISYLCDSLSTLRKILSRMEIQKTYVPEVRYEVGEKDGNTQRICQMSLSTSTNLTGHAKRRPNKWGFGVILDGAELSKYYDIEPYNHADHKLATLRLNKVVRLTDEAAKQYNGSRVILMFGEYGNRLISCANDADLELYAKLISFLKQHDYIQTARNLDYYAARSGEDAWRKQPFGWEGKGKNDARFVHLLPSDIEELYVWPQPFSKFGVPVEQIDEYFQGRFTALMGEYSSFNEEEERIWVENNLMNFIQIPKPALTGIILPEFFREDFEADISTNNNIAWLKQFVKTNGIRVEWHEYLDAEYYKKEFESNDTLEKELSWSNIDRISNDPETILKVALRNKLKFLRGMISDADRKQSSPISVVATAAVKLAIKQYMQELTPENYDAKYAEALAAAKASFKDTLVKDKLTTKPEKQIEELFDYYVPDAPEVAVD
jgi:8-oxo-dGTP pyrophosphatase MutT (NUDIX family)